MNWKPLTLFGAAFCQVGLVSINIYQVSHRHFVGAFFVGFLISLFWTFNIKKVVFGNKMDRIVYCLGAATGTVIGMFISIALYNNIW